MGWDWGGLLGVGGGQEGERGWKSPGWMSSLVGVTKRAISSPSNFAGGSPNTARDSHWSLITSTS